MIAVLQRSAVLQRLFIGGLISGLGDSITWVALSWFVLEQSGNNGSLVGLMLLCFGLPAALTGLPLGKLIDQHGARRIMLLDNLLRAVLIALIPLLWSLGWLELWMVFGLAVLAGALAPASQIGLRVMMPQVVPNDQLEAGNTVLVWTQQIPTVVGPGLAGVLVAAWGAANALWLDALSFGLFALLLLGLPETKPRASTSAVPKFSLAVLRGQPKVLLVTGLTLVFYFAYGPLEAALPMHSKLVLDTSAAGYGLIWSFGGVGMLLGSLLVPRLKGIAPLPLLGSITFLWGIAQLGMGVSSQLWHCVVWMFLGCVAWGPYTALEMAYIQRSFAPQLHGQVFGARSSLLVPVAPLGTAFGGLLLGGLTPSQVIAGSALLCVLAGLVAVIRKV